MTKRIMLMAVIYTAIVASVNPLSAEAVYKDKLEALKSGDMRKLILHADPKELAETPFETFEGEEITLSKYRGKKLLINFWATWCAPCRAEMPSLEDLNQKFGSDEFEVITIATGHNPPPAIDAFFTEIGVQTLTKHRDPLMTLSRKSGVFGLPVTLLVDENGLELGRLQGEADWSAEEAISIIETFTDN